ncbi:Hypothetical predicted protein [Paramuricea clavata]|uniref:Uncharacterized protein n=1 Tax=Paramuricea clavata TaxID=317549 RepID=A0A7D9L8P2_PARCT|nr:Hypothetical predicted protein [Paramuricea clavata]
MGYVDDHIHLTLATDSHATVDQLAESLHNNLRLNNNRTVRVRYNDREIESFTDAARQMSFLPTLPEAAEVMRRVLRNETPQPDTPEEEDVGLISSVDITALDEVTPRQCERIVRRSLARNGLEAREARDPRDNEME